MPNLIIKVTQEVIDDSIQRDSSHCMIAEAVKLAVPGAKFVSVDLQTIRFSNPRTRKRYVYLTPRQGQVALVNFDQGAKPEPFTLALQRPQVVDIPERTPRRDSKKQREALLEKAGVRPDAVVVDGPPEVEESAPKKRTYKKAQIKTSTRAERMDRVGGQAPPAAALATTRGRRREFGLKSLAQ